MAFNNLVDITRLQYFLEKLKALIPSASSAAPGKIASSSSQGSSVNYARQDHTHGIDIATGDSNGQVKIAGNNVSVKGLADLAYKASLGKSDVGLGNVENKSSATIRGELTKANVTTALGYTPPTTDTTYESKTAASGGTDVSLVTTGEKYTWNGKQAALVSGTNIKTINGSSLLGSGDLAVSGLPAVTSSDNDKVLKVVNGVWVAAENDGGSMPVNAAVIHVNAPLGSAITFFKDSTVMEAVTAAQTHPNADGKTEDYYYSVPTSDFGSWTVAASKSGENDATQSFSILVAKQYDAFLSYLAPHDFQAIEWLQTSAAACYFDTGIDITTNTIQTEVYCETIGYGQDLDLTLFGAAVGYAVTANGYRKRWSFCYAISNDVAWDSLLTYTYTEGTDYHLIYNALGGSVNLDDVNVAGSRNRLPKNTNYPRLYIGRYYSPSNGNYYYGQWRYKRFIVSDTSTGEILADFQPCYRKADHVIGFWDHVSNAFFVNLGTGTLTAGPDI